MYEDKAEPNTVLYCLLWPSIHSIHRGTDIFCLCSHTQHVSILSFPELFTLPFSSPCHIIIRLLLLLLNFCLHSSESNYWALYHARSLIETSLLSSRRVLQGMSSLPPELPPLLLVLSFISLLYFFYPFF